MPSSLDASNSDAERFGLLLRDYSAFVHPERCAEFAGLLSRFGLAQQEVLEQRRHNAERFNIFEALQVDEREMYHSRFLAYLLNPHARHDQGMLFLRAFLLEVLRLNMASVAPREVRVVTELWANGYVDIALDLPKVIVFIENKIFAGEQDRQLQRYREALGAQHKRGYLIFLTLDGRVSSSGCEDVSLSYLQLVAILEPLLPGLPERIRYSLEQYLQLCKRLAQET